MGLEGRALVRSVEHCDRRVHLRTRHTECRSERRVLVDTVDGVRRRDLVAGGSHLVTPGRTAATLRVLGGRAVSHIAWGGLGVRRMDEVYVHGAEGADREDSGVYA